MILDRCGPLLGYERPQMRIWNMSFETLYHATIPRDANQSDMCATGLARPTMPHLWSWSCLGRISAIALLFAYSNHLVIAPARILKWVLNEYQGFTYRSGMLFFLLPQVTYDGESLGFVETRGRTNRVRCSRPTHHSALLGLGTFHRMRQEAVYMGCFCMTPRARL
jgi:hypothetical protein